MDTGADGRRDGRRGSRWTRRQYLAAASAGTLLGSLAGCTEPNEIVDSPQVFGYQFPYDSENVHLGPWSTSDPLAFYSILYEPLSHTSPGGDRTMADIVERLDADGDTATLALRDDYSWWSGDPVTARDVWVEDRIQSHVSDAPGPSVELVDDYALRYEFEEPLDEPLVRSAVASRVVRTPADVYESWLERLESAGTADERETVVSDLRSESLGLEEVAERGLGCGPYELVEVSINRLMLERFDDHPRADELPIPRLWFPVVQEVSVENLISKGWIDGGSGLLAGEEGTPPDNLEQLARYRTTAGQKLVFDWRNDHLARRGVRRAVAALLPLDDIVEVADWGEPTKRQSGLAAPAERQWLPDGVRERLHQYPVGTDEDRAAEHMRTAGYTREDGAWRGPDDRQPNVRFGTPVWDDYVPASSVVASHLERFGFDVEHDRIPNTNINHEVINHTYDVLLWTFDGHPYGVYDVTSDGATSIGYGVSDPDASASSQGKPIEVSVPETPGAIDAPESERRTVNLVDAWRRIQRPSDGAETRDAIATFATWWNDALPDLYLGTDVNGLWGNTRDFEWPSYDRDTAYGTTGPTNQPVFHLLKQGAIRPATDE